MGGTIYWVATVTNTGLSNLYKYFWPSQQPWIQILFLFLSVYAVGAKSLQSCPTLCNPTDYIACRVLCSWDSLGKNTWVGCSALLQENLPDPVIKSASLMSPALGGGFFTINATRAYLIDQMVNNLPAMSETWIWSLGYEDPLEEGMATHFILAWRISMDRGSWQATVHEVTKSWTQLSN